MNYCFLTQSPGSLGAL